MRTVPDSLGFRTDLMLLALQGSFTERRDGCTVVRTPANPAFYWGNFLLLDAPPEPGSVVAWCAAFRREFPAAGHLTLGVDGTRGDAGPHEELTAAGFAIERDAVMTATAVHEPPRPNREADFRMLGSDHDWRAALALREANNDSVPTAEYHEFSRRKMASLRRLQEEGHGAWFGAFKGGQMVSGLGVFTDGSGVARFQAVDTHPAHRGEGLAGTLVHTASAYALGPLGARTLVMVADPEYLAIRVYRSVGFAETETQVQLMWVGEAGR